MVFTTPIYKLAFVKADSKTRVSIVCATAIHNCLRRIGGIVYAWESELISNASNTTNGLFGQDYQVPVKSSALLFLLSLFSSLTPLLALPSGASEAV